MTNTTPKPTAITKTNKPMAIDLTKLEKKFIDLFANVTQEEFEQWLLTKTKPMAQQTAVEWLEDKIKDNIFCDHICGIEYWDKETLLGFIEQAKQMEKEQIKRAYKDYPQTICINDNGDFKLLSAEQYYNETYKQHKKNS